MKFLTPLALAATFTSALADEQCSIEASSRFDCGVVGSTEETCEVSKSLPPLSHSDV